jgi:prophage endopeptidase
MKAAVVAILLLIGAYFYGHHKGWNERDAEMQAEIAVKNEESRKKEHELQAQLNTQTSQLMEANNAITQKQSALDRAINSGRVRLPSASCVQVSSDPRPATGNSPEESSESDRQTLSLIAAIAADGDRAIVQLNACIDAYNQVKETVNGQR